MKLDYLSEASADCPLVRIYDFDEEEAAKFKSLVDKLARDPDLIVQIDKAVGVEPVDGCELTLRSGVRDIGLSKPVLRHSPALSPPKAGMILPSS